MALIKPKLGDDVLQTDIDQTEEINKNTTDIASNTQDIQQLSDYQEYMLIPEPGFTINETLIQKKGKIIFVSGVVRGDFPSSVYTKAATLPLASLRPKVNLYAGAATVGGRTAIGVMYNTGGLEFNHVTEATRGWMGFSLSYIVD